MWDLYPAMARELLPTVGFGWAVRAIGFVQLTTLVFACIFMKSRLPPRRSGSLIEMGAFKELDYTFFAAGMFCVCTKLLYSLSWVIDSSPPSICLQRAH